MKGISRYFCKTRFFVVVENVDPGPLQMKEDLHLCSKSSVSNANPDGQK
jgi:hypothetical protein